MERRNKGREGGEKGEKRRKQGPNICINHSSFG